jgi:hypothetical protein
MTDKQKKGKLFLKKQVIAHLGENTIKSVMETNASWATIASGLCHFQLTQREWEGSRKTKRKKK